MARAGLHLRVVVAFALAVAIAPLAAQPPVTAIRAGRLIVSTGAAPIAPAVVLIEGDRITAAGRDVAVPAGARVIPLHDMRRMESVAFVMKAGVVYKGPTGGAAAGSR